MSFGIHGSNLTTRWHNVEAMADGEGSEQYCPECGQRIWRLGKDKFLKCHKCGWTKGWPVVRWVSHPTWIDYYFGGFASWIRRQSYLAFFVKVLVIALTVIIVFAVAGQQFGVVTFTKSPEDIVDEIGDLGNGDQLGDSVNHTSVDNGGSVGSETNYNLNRTEIEYEVHRQINQERRERGLNPLEFDDELQTIARHHSEDMAVNNYFAHEDPDGHGFSYRYDQFNYSCRVPAEGNTYLTGAENIVQTYHHDQVIVWWSDKIMTYETEREIARAIVQSWMHSRGHRKNILTPEWRREGIGVFIEGKEVYATQNFC